MKTNVVATSNATNNLINSLVAGLVKRDLRLTVGVLGLLSGALIAAATLMSGPLFKMSFSGHSTIAIFVFVGAYAVLWACAFFPLVTAAYLIWKAEKAKR